jgi:DNA repair exonuclease SbcCD ATPase subunit
MPKETVDLQKELARKSNVIHNMEQHEKEELEVKLHEMTIEKQSLEQQLVDSKLEITSLQEKLKEDENIEKELKSNYDTKILQTTRNFEEEVKALENELKLKKSSEEEISKLKEELQKHKVTISELEETSRGREIEIANLILNSPSPHGLTDQEFDFSVNSDDRAQVLENELAKYKKKVQELEEEAEDKFETSLCPNCQDREKSEEILIQTKAFVEKIQLDCEKKVQSVSEDLGKMENALNEQIGESKDLKAKLEKAEEDLREERKRSLEISNIGKHFDVNRNVLGLEGADEQMVALEPVQSVLDQEDGKTQIDDNTSDPSNKDVGSLFDEQEKFYKNEVLKKDEEISRLITENEKTQQQIQNLKEKLDEGRLLPFKSCSICLNVTHLSENPISHCKPIFGCSQRLFWPKFPNSTLKQ